MQIEVLLLRDFRLKVLTKYCIQAYIRKVEFTFPRGFGHFQTRLSLCAAILTEKNSRENLPQLTLRFTWLS